MSEGHNTACLPLLFSWSDYILWAHMVMGLKRKKVKKTYGSLLQSSAVAAFSWKYELRRRRLSPMLQEPLAVAAAEITQEGVRSCFGSKRKYVSLYAAPSTCTQHSTLTYSVRFGSGRLRPWTADQPGAAGSRRAQEKNNKETLCIQPEHRSNACICMQNIIFMHI